MMCENHTTVQVTFAPFSIYRYRGSFFKISAFLDMFRFPLCMQDSLAPLPQFRRKALAAGALMVIEAAVCAADVALTVALVGCKRKNDRDGMSPV